MPMTIPNGAAGFSGTLAIANGGTGGATAKDALRLLSGVYVVAQSAVQIPHTGTTSATTLATVTLPAGCMGSNGRVRITSHWSYTNSANNKTLTHRFGGAGGTILANHVVTTTTNMRFQSEVANRNSTSSQVSIPNGLSGFGTTAGAIVNPAIDTTSAVDILFQATLASSGETINLESYLVELIAGAGS